MKREGHRKEPTKELTKGFPKGVKDTDRVILFNIEDDKDLLTLCSLNKYFYNEVCNDMFFKNRLMRKYPNTLKYKEQKNFNKLSWKNYFLRVIFCISKLKEKHKYEYTDGDFNNQMYIFNGSFGNSDFLLRESSKNGELVLVKEALKRGANIDAEDDFALCLASENGHIEVVKYLVEHGANISANDDEALREASLNGHIEVVKYFVENGANISAVHDYDLRLASHKGYTAIVNYLQNLH